MQRHFVEIIDVVIKYWFIMDWSFNGCDDMDCQAMEGYNNLALQAVNTVLSRKVFTCFFPFQTRLIDLLDCSINYVSAIGEFIVWDNSPSNDFSKCIYFYQKVKVLFIYLKIFKILFYSKKTIIFYWNHKYI